MDIRDVVKNRDLMNKTIANLDLSGDVEDFKNNLSEQENILRRKIIEKENQEDEINQSIKNIFPKGHKIVSDMVSKILSSSRDLNGENREQKKLELLIKRHRRALDENVDNNLNLIHSDEFLEWKMSNDNRYKLMVQEQNKKDNKNKIALATTLTGATLMGASSIGLPIATAVGVTGLVLYNAIKKIVSKEFNDFELNKSEEIKLNFDKEIENSYKKIIEKIDDNYFMANLEQKQKLYSNIAFGPYDEPYMVHADNGETFNLLDRSDDMRDVKMVTEVQKVSKNKRKPV